MDKNCTSKKWAISQVSEILKYHGDKLRICPIQRLIILAIASYVDNETMQGWPDLKHIAKYVGIDEKNVSRYITAKNPKKSYFKPEKLRKPRSAGTLCDQKIVIVKRKYDGDKKMTRNYYTLNIDLLLTIATDSKGKVLDIKAQAQTVSNPLHLGSEKCSNIEPSVANTPCSNIEPNVNLTICSDIEPNVNLTGDRNVKLTGGSPYILTTQKATTQKHQERRDIVQMDKNLSKLPVSSFDEFWAAYPRKENRLKAMKIWQSHNLDEKADVIIADVLARRANHKQWQSKEFVPMATTYLNGERWNDEIYQGENEHAKANNESSKPVVKKRVDQMRGVIEQYEQKYGSIFGGGKNGA